LIIAPTLTYIPMLALRVLRVPTLIYNITMLALKGPPTVTYIPMITFGVQMFALRVLRVPM
jgi:hypothetical protein